jgi:hypothetical protein
MEANQNANDEQQEPDPNPDVLDNDDNPQMFEMHVELRRLGPSPITVQEFINNGITFNK